MEHSDLLLQHPFKTFVTYIWNIETLDTYVYNIRFQCNMGEQCVELARWRRLYETATAGEARDGRGASVRGVQSGRGARSGLRGSKRCGQGARSERRVFRPDERTPLRGITVKESG